MGTFPGANGRNFQSIAKRASQLLRKGAKMDVLDPVLGGGIVTPSAQNIKWVPIRADADVEFSLAVIRWMMENGRVNTTFVSYPNYQAAYAAGYASYTNATHLVIVDPANANYLKLLSAADAGLETPASVTDATKCDVVIDAATGQPAVYLNSTAAQLEYEGEVNGIKVRTGYLFLKDNVNEHTMDEYSQMCGVPIAEIERIADEFTSHGVKSSARGIGSTVVVNGIGATQAFRTLNALIGANQMVGGLLPFRNTFKTMGDAPRYKLATIAGSPKLTAQAISRTNKLFQKTKEYENRVAAGEKNPQPKLPWFSSATNSDNQAIVSVVNQYPYQAKILLTWMNNAIQAAPGALRDEVIDRLKDTSIVPLHVACDCFFGEQTQLADYIVPDTTPFESFAVATQEGYWYGKGDGVRWPVKDQETIELADGRHASFEAFVVDVAKACDVPGFGDNAIEAADGTKWPLNDACDFFLKGVANLAFDGESPVADISAEDIDLQGLDALPAAWKASVSAEEWPKVQNVLSRGGRFLPIEKAYSADGTRSAFAKEYQCLIYSQPKAVKKNPYSGDRTSGCLRVEPQMFADNSKMTERYSEEEYPLRQCCHKPHFRSVSMQSNSPIMRDLCSTNYIELNIDDAAAAGVADGDKVRLAMPDGCAVAGEAMVRAGIARGSFGIGFGYGHRAYGTQDETVDGATTKGIAAIGAGTPVMAQLDPTITDGLYFLADNDTGCPARNGGMFRVEKA